ncbi:MAG: undecaprenyl-diphosphate phosphatase [Acidimicrobiales bacterium]|nr:undecaprenyl-diphosphate phosphatase [Acidimicrobiales bacterium]
MPIVHAIVLGAVQGLTEFLPISSSGHLVLVPWVMGWDDFRGDDGLAKTFDVALHLGTLVGVVAYFWRDLLGYARHGLASLVARRFVSPEGRTAWLLLLSAVPAAITGATLQGFIEGELGAPWLIGVNLILFGLLLGWADRLHGNRPAGRFGLRDSLLMGTGQALALSPGVSRSGVTMTVGRWIGFDRASAARLSFLMSIPVTTGALLYKGLDALQTGIPDDLRGAFVAGVVASAVFGWVAVWATLTWLRTRTFTPFVAYRLVAGGAVLLVAAAGWR